MPERRVIPAPRRRRTFSWVIGGYEWRRHLHFQPSGRHHSRFYDQARGRILSKSHNSSCLADRHKNTPAFSVSHYHKNSSQISVAAHQKKQSAAICVFHHQKSSTDISIAAHQNTHSAFSVFHHQKNSSDISVIAHQKCSDLCVLEHQVKASAEGKSKGGLGIGVRKLWQGLRVSLWKKLLKKLKAKAKKSRPIRAETLNYDVASYKKNFDDGKWYSNPSFQASSDCLKRSHSARVHSSTHSCEQLHRQRSAPSRDSFCERESQQLDPTVVS